MLSACARSRRRTCPSPSWVNTHLQYTHGNGAVVALANQTNSGNPVYAVQDVPPPSSNGLPTITQPDVYFGLGEPGYVVADTKQLEVDYQKDGTARTSRATTRARAASSCRRFFTRAAFALRLGDFNLLISSQITDQSRIMFVRDPVAMAQKAAPFLSFDHDPYAVIDRRPHRLGGRRLHDDRQLPLLAERQQPAGGDREHPARRATTTCATR